MSAVVGVFDRRGRAIDEAVIRRMLAPLRSRGERTHIYRADPGAVLAVARHDWERDDALSGRELVTAADDLVVAADAAVYYRPALARRLTMRGVRANGAGPGHLILAAYRAWRDRCPERLEGELAFLVYDRQRQTVFCARDQGGGRPLYWADLDGTLLVASSVNAIAAHPRCPQDLNLAQIAESAAFLAFSLGHETCYSAIHPVPMGGSLSWSGRPTLRQHWTPPLAEGGASTPFRQAASELKEILADAVAERLAPEGPTSVWMSGGYDSTAVFGAGQHALSRNGQADRLKPVSLSYPKGDLGREDEIISAVADAWDAPVHWLDVDDIPVFADDEAWAAERDDAASSPYENLKEALGKGARAVGARVALDGNGGDLIFAASNVYLTDLLRRGRWLTLARELRTKAKRRKQVPKLLAETLHPLLPPTLLAGVARLRRDPTWRHHLARPLPPWLRSDFIARFGLIERQEANLPSMKAKTLAQAELHWAINLPLLGYSQAQVQLRCLRNGVLLRSPLFDRRVMDYALSRPNWERVSGRHKKHLLRASMRGLIPEEVLAPRRFRTGMTLWYERRKMKQELPRRYERLLRNPLLLAELGVVDPSLLRDSVAAYTRDGGDALRTKLYYTLQTELWLRARLGVGR